MRVLLWAHMRTHFREMFRIARVLASGTQYEPVVFFEAQYPGCEEDQARCDYEGVPWIRQASKRLVAGPHVADGLGAAPTEPFRPPPPPAVRRSLVVRGLRWARYLFYRYVLAYYVAVRLKVVPKRTGTHYQSRQLDQCRDLLAFADVQILVFPEDNVEFATAALILAGHERGIPSVVVPYTICNASEPAESYFASRPHQAHSFFNRSAAQEFPRWVYRHRGRDLIRLPAAEVRAKELFGLAPPLPWVFNSGAADAIVVESPALKDYYLRAGLPAPQLRVLGSIRLDDLAGFHRQALAERRRVLDRFGWAEEGCVIVTAVPPNQRPWTRPGCEFTSYEDLVAFWVRALADVSGSRVLINPHPRGDARALYGLERHNVRVAEGDVARLIPLCDLYVASVSATIPMALACGKPVVNYDVYRYGYDDFAASSLVQTVLDRAGYCAALANWQTLARRGRAGSPQPRWGPLDGLSGARLTGLFDEVLAGAARKAEARKAG